MMHSKVFAYLQSMQFMHFVSNIAVVSKGCLLQKSLKE